MSMDQKFDVLIIGLNMSDDEQMELLEKAVAVGHGRSDWKFGSYAKNAEGNCQYQWAESDQENFRVAVYGQGQQQDGISRVKSIHGLIICYKVKPRGDIAHILSCIEEGARYNQQQKKQMKRQEAELNDPIITVESILLGKLKICELLAEMGAEEKAVDLPAFQNKYQDKYSVVFDKKELKDYFPTGELKPIMTEFLYNEVEIIMDLNKSGSMFFQLKKPWEEIKADCKRIFQELGELNNQLDDLVTKLLNELGEFQDIPMVLHAHKSPILEQYKFSTNGSFNKCFQAMRDQIIEDYRAYSKAENEKVQSEEAAEADETEDEEYLKRLQQPPPLPIQGRGMILSKKRQEKQEAMGILDTHCNPGEKVEGVFNETYRTGKGAQLEAERRQHMEALLAEEADNLEGKPTLVVAKGKELSYPGLTPTTATAVAGMPMPVPIPATVAPPTSSSSNGNGTSTAIGEEQTALKTNTEGDLGVETSITNDNSRFAVEIDASSSNQQIQQGNHSNTPAAAATLEERIAKMEDQMNTVVSLLQQFIQHTTTNQ